MEMLATWGNDSGVVVVGVGLYNYHMLMLWLYADDRWWADDGF
jgi:hypothetical protein